MSRKEKYMVSSAVKPSVMRDVGLEVLLAILFIFLLQLSQPPVLMEEGLTALQVLPLPLCMGEEKQSFGKSHLILE